MLKKRHFKDKSMAKRIKKINTLLLKEKESILKR